MQLGIKNWTNKILDCPIQKNLIAVELGYTGKPENSNPTILPQETREDEIRSKE